MVILASEPDAMLRKTLVHISWQLSIASGKNWKIEVENRKYMNGLGGKVSKSSIFLTNYKKVNKIPVKGPKMSLSPRALHFLK